MMWRLVLHAFTPVVIGIVIGLFFGWLSTRGDRK